MKELFVRIHPKSIVERFFRCGMEFTKAWKSVEVDAATAQRLKEEQMLETADTADMLDQAIKAIANDVAAADSSSAAGSGQEMAAGRDTAAEAVKEDAGGTDAVQAGDGSSSDAAAATAPADDGSTADAAAPTSGKKGRK